MTISAAFGELTEILDSLDRSDVTVMDISVVEEGVQGANEITAELTVGVSLLDESQFSEDVSVTADGVDLLSDELELDLTVSVSDIDGLDSGVETVTDSSIGGSIGSLGTGTPAYKDPDTLAEVYERCDSFPEMTEALDVDVTSETVRRHAIKYGIHDPDEGSTPNIDSSEGTADATGRSRETTEQTADGTESARTTDRENAADEGEDTDPNLSERPLADLLAKTEEGVERRVADGSGIPRDLTVGQLVSALETSRTVYETTQHLDTGYETTRRLLDELDLMPYVNGRLSSADRDIDPLEVCRQMGIDDVAV